MKLSRRRFMAGLSLAPIAALFARVMGIRYTPTEEEVAERALAEEIEQIWDDAVVPLPRGGEFRRVASIPMPVAEQWYKEGVNIFDDDHMTEVRRRLELPENAHLRFYSGEFGDLK